MAKARDRLCFRCETDKHEHFAERARVFFAILSSMFQPAGARHRKPLGLQKLGSEDQRPALHFTLRGRASAISCYEPEPFFACDSFDVALPSFRRKQMCSCFSKRTEMLVIAGANELR